MQLHIAPTLQILLTKMWVKATEANFEHPQFSQDLYQHLKRDGILLRDFVIQQIETARERYPDGVDSGLLLDILALHTTPLGTSNQCSLEQLQLQYAHVGTVLPYLLQECQDLYLLNVATSVQAKSEKTTRLAHDTLAPLVREQFEQSDKPGQRAARILRTAGVVLKDATVHLLGEQELTVVLSGKRGMRAWTKTEEELVHTSRPATRRQEFARAAKTLFSTILMATIYVVIIYYVSTVADALPIGVQFVGTVLGAILAVGMLVANVLAFGLFFITFSTWQAESLLLFIQRVTRFDVEVYRQTRRRQKEFIQTMEALVGFSLRESTKVARHSLLLSLLAEHVDENGSPRPVIRGTERIPYCGISHEIDDALKCLIDAGLIKLGRNTRITYLSENEMGPIVLKEFRVSSMHKAKTLVQRIERELATGKPVDSIRLWNYQVQLVRENAKYLPPLSVDVEHVLNHPHWLI